MQPSRGIGVEDFAKLEFDGFFGFAYGVYRSIDQQDHEQQGRKRKHGISPDHCVLPSRPRTAVPRMLLTPLSAASWNVGAPSLSLASSPPSTGPLQFVNGQINHVVSVFHIQQDRVGLVKDGLHRVKIKPLPGDFRGLLVLGQHLLETTSLAHGLGDQFEFVTLRLFLINRAAAPLGFGNPPRWRKPRLRFSAAVPSSRALMASSNALCTSSGGCASLMLTAWTSLMPALYCPQNIAGYPSLTSSANPLRRPQSTHKSMVFLPMTPRTALSVTPP